MSKSDAQSLINEIVTKASIRQHIWDYLESKNLSDFPRPVHHRIPNFKGAKKACDKAWENIESLRHSRVIKVNPDKPQQQCRYLALESHKTLLVPTPRLEKGLFNRIQPPPGATKHQFQTCSSSQGVKQYSSPIGLDAKVKVDSIVIGSVAVSTKGYRLGKGEGYADIEWAMMSSMGAVDDNTVVITTVHDCQVQNIPDELMADHDLCVDYIVTPTQVIKCDICKRRPTGIYWNEVSSDMLKKIPVLKLLRNKEMKMGKDVTLSDKEDR